MDLIATVKKIETPQSGVSKAGNAWKRMTVIAEYGDQYMHDVAFTFINEKCDLVNNFTIGAKMKFFFDISSREYNERWYTEAIVWKVEPFQAQSAPAMPTSAPVPQPAPIPNYAPPTNADVPNVGDGLPFWWKLNYARSTAK